MTSDITILRYTRAEEISSRILSNILDEGYTDNEIIPGLILAASLLVESTDSPEIALEEAIMLLEDGFPYPDEED